MVGYSKDAKSYRIYFPQKNTIEMKRYIVFFENDMNTVHESVEIMLLEDQVSQETETVVNEENNTEDIASKNRVGKWTRTMDKFILVVTIHNLIIVRDL